MNCPNCGREVKETDKFCVICGTQVRSGNANADNGAPTMDSMSELAGKVVNTATKSLTGTSKSGINFMVRRYFFGLGEFLMIALVLWGLFTLSKLRYGMEYSYSHGVEINGFGIFCTVIQFASGILFFAAIGLSIYIQIIGGGKNAVDDATEKSIIKLKARARQKFNVDIDQIKEIDPIIVSGAGAPSSLVMGVTTSAIRYVGLFSRLYSKDPVPAYKVGHDGIPRYLLLQTTVYAFTDTQLLVYSGNIDISTGIIYDETVSEIFYSDINSITQQDVLKKFVIGLFKRKYYTQKYLQLDVCGCAKTASFDERFAQNADTSLAGMESFIREKKY